MAAGGETSETQTQTQSLEHALKHARNAINSTRDALSAYENLKSELPIPADNIWSSILARPDADNIPVDNLKRIIARQLYPSLSPDGGHLKDSVGSFLATLKQRVDEQAKRDNKAILDDPVINDLIDEIAKLYVEAERLQISAPINVVVGTLPSNEGNSTTPPNPQLTSEQTNEQISHELTELNDEKAQLLASHPELAAKSFFKQFDMLVSILSKGNIVQSDALRMIEAASKGVLSTNASTELATFVSKSLAKFAKFAQAA